jgi:hypothetical protein
MPGRVKSTVDLRVLDTYPLLPAEFAQKIRLWPVLDTESLNVFEKGKEYMISLRQYADIFWIPSLGNMGKPVCTIDPNSSIVSGFKYGPMSLDETWKLIADYHDAIHEGILPSDEVLNYWLAKLQSDDLTDCQIAIDYFGILPEPIIPQDILVELVEYYLGSLGQNYRAILEHEALEPKGRDGHDQWEKVFRKLRNDADQEISFLTNALEMLIWVADEPDVERILTYYEKDAALPESVFNWEDQDNSIKPLMASILRLVLKHPGPKRYERFMRLVSFKPLPKLMDGDMLVAQLVRTNGEDIDRLLMQMVQYPATFGIDRSFEYRGHLCGAIARRESPEFGDYLEQFLADPNESDFAKFKDYKPEQFEQAIEATEVLFNTYYGTQTQRENSRKRRLQDLVDRFRNGQSDIRHDENWTVRAISEIITSEDTEFVSVLVEGANDLRISRSHAIDIATRLADPCFVPIIRKALEQDVTFELIELIKALYVCGAQQEAVEWALTILQDSASEEIIRFVGTTGDTSVLPVIEDFTSDEFWYAPHSQRIAVLALARLGGESAIPRLKEIYESEDTDILVRINTALALYSLGDDTGYELLEYFLNDTERCIVELEERWGYDIGSHEAFSPLIGYLRSPRTDALLIECLRRGRVDKYELYPSSPFFMDHEREILPILVDNLESKDRRARRYANGILKEVTGQDFGFKPDRFVGQQTEAVERWRSYVEQYLEETAQTDE